MDGEKEEVKEPGCIMSNDGLCKRRITDRATRLHLITCCHTTDIDPSLLLFIALRDDKTLKGGFDYFSLRLPPTAETL